MSISLLSSLMLLAAVLATAPFAYSEVQDPKPPQVSIDFFYPPSSLVQQGKPRLVYEMRLANYLPLAYDLDSIDVAAGAKRFSFSGDTLRTMMRFLGEKAPTATTNRIGAGQGGVIYFMLSFDQKKEVPSTLQHTLHFTYPDGTDHALTPEPLRVGYGTPVTVAPPLSGDNWIAGDAVHNGPDAAHRRTILLLDGHPWLAQRYAIDWVRYRIGDGIATTWSGPEDQNASYLCYNAPILSVADGKVVEAVDGIPENVPHSGKYAVDINFVNAGGNHVVVDIGNSRYVFYAHMRPGSLKVKKGDHVKTGQEIGNIGNTGSSTEPHLHMHIVDRPSFLAGHGVPYEFTRFDASGSPEMLARPHDEMMFRDFGPLHTFHNDYPAANAAVNFR